MPCPKTIRKDILVCYECGDIYTTTDSAMIRNHGKQCPYKDILSHHGKHCPYKNAYNLLADILGLPKERWEKLKSTGRLYATLMFEYTDSETEVSSSPPLSPGHSISYNNSPDNIFDVTSQNVPHNHSIKSSPSKENLENDL